MPLALYNLGESYHYMGQEEKAETYLKQAIEIGKEMK
ncbi:tetratricopeptide repeat protein [Bacillus atrophaeus]|nr:tetratricopeptide repeat protein [Bacillus atrophaeus]